MIHYGDTIILKHFATGAFLHSHLTNYTTGSNNQHVTGVKEDSAKNEWMVMPPFQSVLPKKTPVMENMAFSLSHVPTKMMLSSNKAFSSPVTNQQEVCWQAFP